MKNRKTFIAIALLIVVLLIGIGYAAVTGTLTINGTATATATDSNLKVVFTGETSDVDDGVTPTVTAGSTIATMNVEGLIATGDSKSATFEIQNQSEELNAVVAATTKEISNTEYFAVDATVANTAPLTPDDTTTVTVTVSLIKTPIENVNGTINVELTATASEAE